MKLKVKTYLKNSSETLENIYEATKEDNKIIYQDCNTLVTIDLSGKIKRENNEYCLEIDLINNKGYYLLKDNGFNLDLKIKTKSLISTNQILKTEYSIESEIILFEIKEV